MQLAKGHRVNKLPRWDSIHAYMRFPSYLCASSDRYLEISVGENKYLEGESGGRTVMYKLFFGFL